MASESVVERGIHLPDGSSRPRQVTYDHESPIDTFDRKLTQAEALAKILCGAGGDGFRTFNDAIQDNVQWLLSDLISEVRIAHDKYWEERGEG